MSLLAAIAGRYLSRLCRNLPEPEDAASSVGHDTPEDEALKAELQGIWGANGAVLEWKKESPNQRRLHFVASLAEDVRVEGTGDFSGHYWYTLSRIIPFHERTTLGARLVCEENARSIIEREGPMAHERPGELERLITEWKPWFRRACWLSGCPLDYSAHEQVEDNLWIQERERQLML